jgi:hypothetical protein
MKTINKKRVLYGLAIIVLLQGCAEVLEKDLSKEKVQLVAPSNGISAPDSVALTFAWDSLDGASQYRLQIASPSFDSIVQLIADTPVAGMFLSLPAFSIAGKYQWRVMASNTSSSSPYSAPWTFTIQ